MIGEYRNPPMNDREFLVWEDGRRQGHREAAAQGWQPSHQAIGGCICPPGANKECENPLCPRKPPLHGGAGFTAAVARSRA